jgi:hypothetical protein
MFDDEVEEKPKSKKKAEKTEPPKVGRFSTPYGRVPVSATYGNEFPTCWMKHLNKVVTHTS